MLISASVQIHQSCLFQYSVSGFSLQPYSQKPSKKPIENDSRRKNVVYPTSSSRTNIHCCSDRVKIRNSSGEEVIPGSKITGNVSFDRCLDPNVLASVLQGCSNCNQVRSIHAFVLKVLDRPVTFLINNFISAYVRFRELKKARQLFDEMGDRDIVSWTAMLNGYSKLGLDEEVLKLFMDLAANGFQPNRFTLACLLNLCARRSDLALGKQIHTHVVKSSLKSLILDSSLVYFYSSCGLISGAFEVFNRMTERDVICWTTMITACAQRGFGYEALSMFSQMQLDGFHPNEFTFCSALKACGEEEALKFGKQLHGVLVKKMLRLDVFVMSSLLGMYVKCGEVLDARTVFDGMSKRNTVTWTSMIAGYAQNGYGEEAIGLFRRMNRRRIFASYLTVVSILSACGLVRSLNLGKEIHAKILKNNMEKNVYIGTTLIWFYCRCGSYSYAIKILEAMPVKDVVSWTAIISGHARLGNGMEALEFLNNMLWEGVEPNPFTYSSALKACTRIEAVKEGKLIHASANKALALSNVYVGSALIDLYAKCGLVEDAFHVFDNMPERNIVVWKTMIIGYARNGMCKEALQLLYRMQAEGIKMDDLTVATVLSACGDVKWVSKRSSMCTLNSAG
ncbi:hypothetical protein H6P81_011590 [Aristolochia fimbriata]|uniref:Pentatricopeptide repeat-containing protein n=1 Tax=Aristolochia fimbriata TaxID=158543 RepID=A0AAV7ERX9_ARIFI|nr:hypothetical protein H6P81_011590 [Aristolochia fimbriata]